MLEAAFSLISFQPALGTPFSTMDFATTASRLVMMNFLDICRISSNPLCTSLEKAGNMGYVE